MENYELDVFQIYLVTEKRSPLNTAAAYISDLKQYGDFLAKKQVPLSASTLALAKEYLHFLKVSVGLSATSMARKISSLKIFFSWTAKEYGWHNYTLDLTCPKIPRRLPCYLTNQEVDELLACASQQRGDLGVRNKTMLYLLYVSGMRISELTSLTRSHFTNQSITVEGKGGKQRLIPLPTMMIDMVHEYLENGHKKFVKKNGDTDYVFPIVYGGKIKSISRQSCWIILKNLCAKTSINRPVWPHQLRHSLATHLLKNGADLRSLQLLLGHENIATVEIYTHLDTRYLRNIYDKKHPRS